MICVSFGNKDYDECIKVIKMFDFVEIRMDLCQFSSSQIQYIFSTHKNLIATYKNTQSLPEELLAFFLNHAIEFGANYIDIDSTLSSKTKLDILQKAKLFNCKSIYSYHNYECTPQIEELNNIIENGIFWNFDFIKIACKVNEFSDSARLLSLYSNISYKNKLIVIGMGRMGRIVRIASLKLGAPFTFCSSKPGSETAEGQMDYETLNQLYKII